MKKSTAPGKVSKAEQRVIIAKDALAQLKAEKFLAQQGSYLSPELYSYINAAAYGNDSLQAQSFIKKAPVCTVCAKGALFLSAIRKYNKATVEDVICDNMEVAEKIFGEKQFNLIEAAFEQWDYFPPNNSDEQEIVPAKVYEFGKQYENDHDRLQAILKNIITNKGTFKP